MTSLQKIIKFLSVAFGILLCICIIGGIITVLSSVSSFFGNKSSDGEIKTYLISQDISELDIDIGGCALNIKRGNEFKVESNNTDLNLTERESTLRISEESSSWRRFSESTTLDIYIPDSVNLYLAELNTGAGKVYIERLFAKNLKLDFGAGSVTIDELTATDSAIITGGAGKITVSGGSLAELDFDMGVGALNLTSRLSGDCELDMGVGNSDITLIGKSDDYKIKIDKGLGSVRVDGVKVSDNAVCGSGNNNIDIDGGVGNIKVDFSAD